MTFGTPFALSAAIQESFPAPAVRIMMRENRHSSGSFSFPSVAYNTRQRLIAGTFHGQAITGGRQGSGNHGSVDDNRDGTENV